MADNIDKETPTPNPIHGNLWLDSILGPISSSAKAATEAPSPAVNRSFEHQLLFKTDFRLPDGAILTGVEVREVPSEVYTGSGDLLQAGTWSFTCDHLDSVSFYVDDAKGIRPSTTVVAKFLLTRAEDERVWSEVEAGQLVLVKNTIAEDNGPQAIDAASNVNRDSCVASVIDLDISIDADSIGEEENVSILLSGLVPGAILTAGNSNDEGVWSVGLTDLKDLAIIVPDDTPPFDLNVTLGDDEAAIRVNVPSSDQAHTDNALRLRLSPSSELTPHRIRVFADGREIYDRVMLWGDDPDIPLDILIGLPTDDELPFELLIREESITGNSAQSANLLAAEFNDQPVQLDNDLVRGNVSLTTTGLSWRGDLILSARNLGDRAQSHNTEAPAPPIDVAPNMDEPPKDKTQAHNPKKQSSDQSDVLVIQASSSDMERTGFIDELNALQSFVRARPDQSDEVVYERLGLMIKNWRDVKVLGPTNAEVDLNPELPSLAPMGGRDNAVHTIALSEKSYSLSRYDLIEIRGLPKGCLLTHGLNLGDGRWKIYPDQIPHTHIIGLLSSTPATVAHIFATTPNSSDTSDEVTNAHMVGDLLIGGGSRRVTPTSDHNNQINIPLEANTFDPDGYGTLSLTIGDVPNGVLLSQGSNHGDGVWTHEAIAGSHLGFQIIVPRRSFSVSITCVAMNNDTGESTVITHRARIRPDRMEVVLDQAVMA